MRPRLLFVDDEPAMLAGLRRLLHGHAEEWEMVFEADSAAALDRLREGAWDVLVTDLQMPRLGGFELLGALRSHGLLDDLLVIVLTGHADGDMKRRALELGATDLVSKPIAEEDLLARLRSVLRLKDYQNQLKAHRARLEEQVAERTLHLEQAQRDIVARLGKTTEFRDDQTGHHVVRVAYYCRLLAERLGLSPRETETVAAASTLHDIGKVGIPDAVLLKPGRLTDEERATMQRHCAIGAAILDDELPPLLGVAPGPHGRAGNPLLGCAAAIVMGHHEWWDGSGYPRGLAGDAIPLTGRVAALADVYDALSSERPYKAAYPEERVVAILTAEAPRHFDPDLFRIFLSLRESFHRVRTEWADAPGVPAL